MKDRILQSLDSYDRIEYDLNTKLLGRTVVYLSEVDSTNEYAKKIASEGCEEGTLILADRQISGRGRLGREWVSSSDKGVWMSLVLRTFISPAEIQIITLGAAVAIVKALENVVGVSAGIKWPNDIILGGKKVCGILTEMNVKMNKVNFIVLGIGINIIQDSDEFPKELSDKAISLKMYFDDLKGKSDKFSDIRLIRREIVKEVVSCIENIYFNILLGRVDEIINEWKKYSVTLGREIVVLDNGREIRGIAEDITNTGALLVRSDDGVVSEVLSGEISVRGVFGYC